MRTSLLNNLRKLIILPDIHQSISDFNAAILVLDNALEEFQDEQPSAEEAAMALAALHAIKGNFAAVYERMEYIVSTSMGSTPEVVLADGIKIEKRYGASRKSWQHKDLAHVVASRISDMSVDMDTGERLMSTEDMIVKVLDYVQPSYWRIKELNNIGINPDRFCEVSEGKTSIIVRKAG